MKRAWIGAGIVVAGSVLVEALWAHVEHPEFFWHRLPGFDFLYGVLGCILIGIASKGLGHSLLQRDENYYQEDEPS